MSECIPSLVNVQFPSPPQFLSLSVATTECNFSLFCFSICLHLTLCLLSSSPMSVSFQVLPLHHQLPTSSQCWAPPSWHSRLLLSLPLACPGPYLSDVKYHHFTHLHLIFSRPSRSPSYLPPTSISFLTPQTAAKSIR